MKYKILSAFLLTNLILGLSNVAPSFADEICRPCPFDCSGIGLSSNHCGQRAQRFDQCCVDLDGEGQNQLRMKDQENRNNTYNSNNNNSGYNQQECPSGFNPRRDKCSPDERARGCKDTRSASGQSCIAWRSG